MSVFFAMIGAGDDRRPAFFLTRKAAPEGAVEIGDARHGELIEALGEGRAIDVDARGRPVLVRRQRPAAEELRAGLRAAIRREAAQRIRAVSPEWQQLNDLRTPSDAGAVRFARIDAIRAASNAIEDLASGLPVADLAAFPIATHTLWPEFD
jgi:hypothetical protein